MKHDDPIRQYLDAVATGRGTPTAADIEETLDEVAASVPVGSEFDRAQVRAQLTEDTRSILEASKEGNAGEARNRARAAAEQFDALAGPAASSSPGDDLRAVIDDIPRSL